MTIIFSETRQKYAHGIVDGRYCMSIRYSSYF
jgi:hypothetical protein